MPSHGSTVLFILGGVGVVNERTPLSLLQLVDSALPTGTFSHSFGLETAVQEGQIKNEEELKIWLAQYIKGTLSPMEGQGVYLSFQLLVKGDLKGIRKVDHHLTLSRIPRESREGGIKIGKRYLYLLLELYPDFFLRSYQEEIRQSTCFGNAAIVHGGICVYLKFSLITAVESFLYMSVNSLVQNAVRVLSIGQTAGQKILLSLFPLIQSEAREIVESPVEVEELCNRNFIQEIHSMRHERLYSRLFMS